jgi:UDP-N-acetylglucosamine/UDP-N-acetylgalactosamine 4-epimerase
LNNKYNNILKELLNQQHKWLITGVAGFIGSNLLEQLLLFNQVVVGLDNMSTGSKKNLNEVQENVTHDQWSNFNFIEGSIESIDICKKSIEGVDFVLHQAALGSVPRSIENPIATNSTNIVGFLNMLVAAKESEVRSFVYAASSSTYGDHPDLPKVEENIGNPLSPYAVTKLVNEIYGDVFKKIYNFNSIGLRYFNVFGPRQNPNGAYAAVIPKFISSMINNKNIVIFGDGSTSRDFCYVQNVVQANILAALSGDDAQNRVYNIALGDRTSLTDLYSLIVEGLSSESIIYSKEPIFENFRDGDVLHSLASIKKAISFLGYQPSHNIKSGMKDAIPWYIKNSSSFE